MVLAAGRSRRLGEPKQLIPYGGMPLVERAARLAATVCGPRVIVVTGAAAAAVGRAVHGLELDLVHNPCYRSGLSSSLAAGLAALDPPLEAALVLTCDQPRVGPGDLGRLVGTWQASPARPAAAAYDDILGVPAILPRHLFTELLELRGDRGAGSLLRRLPVVAAVPMRTACFDVDDAGDLSRLGGRSAAPLSLTPG